MTKYKNVLLNFTISTGIVLVVILLVLIKNKESIQEVIAKENIIKNTSQDDKDLDEKIITLSHINKEQEDILCEHTANARYPEFNDVRNNDVVVKYRVTNESHIEKNMTLEKFLKDKEIKKHMSLSVTMKYDENVDMELVQKELRRLHPSLRKDIKFKNVNELRYGVGIYNPKYTKNYKIIIKEPTDFNNDHIDSFIDEITKDKDIIRTEIPYRKTLKETQSYKIVLLEEHPKSIE